MSKDVYLLLFKFLRPVRCLLLCVLSTPLVSDWIFNLTILFLRSNADNWQWLAYTIAQIILTSLLKLFSYLKKNNNKTDLYTVGLQKESRGNNLSWCHLSFRNIKITILTNCQFIISSSVWVVNIRYYSSVIWFLKHCAVQWACPELDQSFPAQWIIAGEKQGFSTALKIGVLWPCYIHDMICRVLVQMPWF